MSCRRTVAAYLALPGLFGLVCGALGGCGDARADPGSESTESTAPSREVHWTIVGPHAIAVDWRDGGTSITYWDSDEPPRRVPARLPEPAPAKSDGSLREARLDDLAAGHTYRYRVGGEPAGSEHFFQAPPSDCSVPFTFVAEGDIGASSQAENAAAVQRLAADVKPRFVLVLGDLSYADGDPALLREHLDDVTAWSRDAAYMPAWGNHEWQGDAGELRRYKTRFALPHAQASPGVPANGCCGEDWSWFDYGCARFISYPEPYGPETWNDWAAHAQPLLEAAEKDPGIRYVITFGHRPAYSSGGHHGDERLRRILDAFGKKFDKYMVNLAGHSHGYERSRRKKGLVHLTVGTGGARLGRAHTPCGWPSCQPPRWSRFRALHHGVLAMTVSADRLEGRFVCGPASAAADVTCAAGETLDRFTVP